MTPIRVRPEAELEAEDAALYYDEQQPGLGLDFLLEVDQTLQRIRDRPKGYHVLYRGVRRAPLRRFPYGAFYYLEGEEAVVFAVLHLTRDPDTWKTRARSK